VSCHVRSLDCGHSIGGMGKANPVICRFNEYTAGGYHFNARLWRTNDGCHNIDFEGALDAHHGYCCGSLPCDFTA
jgi:hypothetical protein